MRPSAIVEHLRQILGGIPVRTGRFHQRAFGIYKPDVQTIRLKVANNLQTFFHEEGHHVDLGILRIDRADTRWAQELIDLGQATSSPSYSKDLQRKEGAAEFLRLWLTDPPAVRRAAPAYTAEFERRLDRPAHADLRAGLQRVREDIQGLISQDPATRGRLRIDRSRPPSALRRAAATHPGHRGRGRRRPALRQLGFGEIWLGQRTTLVTVVSHLASGEPSWCGRDRT